jgi:hypothetical protein
MLFNGSAQSLPLVVMVWYTNLPTVHGQLPPLNVCHYLQVFCRVTCCPSPFCSGSLTGWPSSSFLAACQLWTAPSSLASPVTARPLTQHPHQTWVAMMGMCPHPQPRPPPPAPWITSSLCLHPPHLLQALNPLLPLPAQTMTPLCSLTSQQVRGIAANLAFPEMRLCCPLCSSAILALPSPGSYPGSCCLQSVACAVLACSCVTSSFLWSCADDGGGDRVEPGLLPGEIEIQPCQSETVIAETGEISHWVTKPVSAGRLAVCTGL